MGNKSSYTKMDWVVYEKNIECIAMLAQYGESFTVNKPPSDELLISVFTHAKKYGLKNACILCKEYRPHLFENDTEIDEIDLR